MNALESQLLGGIFTLQYTILKMTVLLHKTALVNFPIATTLLERETEYHLNDFWFDYFE